MLTRVVECYRTGVKEPLIQVVLVGAVPDESKREDLKPELEMCPICGSSVHILKNDEGKYYISCGYCPLETQAAFSSEEEAVYYWNERD